MHTIFQIIGPCVSCKHMHHSNLKLPQKASAFIIHSSIFIIQNISNVELLPAFSKKLFIRDGLPFLLMLPSQTTK